MDFWFEYMIPSAINAILMSVGDAKFKLKFRKAFLKVYRTIGAAFMQDPEFIYAAQQIAASASLVDRQQPNPQTEKPESEQPA